MLEARRSKVMKGIGVIALVFGLSLVYFFFFNTGLTLTPDPTNQGGQVIVSNTSVHLIRNISVHFIVNGQLIEAEKIVSLGPKETHAVPLYPQYASDGKFVVQVSAPYHLTQQVIVQAHSNAVDNASVSFTFQYPSIVTANQSLDVEVGACNLEAFPIDVSVALDLPSGLPPVDVESWQIAASDCSSITLSFTPLSPSDDLSFKIRVFTPTKVLVEKLHHVQVLADAQSTDENVLADEDTVMDENTSTLEDFNSLAADMNADTNGGA